jgi:FdhD protein
MLPTSVSRATQKTKTQIWVVESGRLRQRQDHVTTEEPLEIRLQEPAQTLAITMRTPGADFELTAGFLYGEGVIQHRSDLERLTYCVDPQVDGQQRQNIVNVSLKTGLTPDLSPLERHFYTSSACGVCGKTSLAALEIKGCQPIPQQWQVAADVIYRLPEQLRLGQGQFSATGGLHAAALFNQNGDCLAVREDVGRHNAVDKLVGASLLAAELPWSQQILLVSGRASYEILQKALMAKVPMVCALSAPSSLAVDLAQAFNITLIGFLRGERFNLYSGAERIVADWRLD